MHLLLPLSIGLWAVGVQLTELFAAIGSIATALLILPTLKPTRAAAKRWLPLFCFVGWGLTVPLVAGHLPSGSGVARLSDWLLIPIAAIAVRRLSPLALERVLAAATVTLLVSCAVAGLQHFGVWPPEESFSWLGWTRIPFSRVYEPVPGSDGRFMGGGLLFHRLRWAEVTGLGVIAAAAAAMHHKSVRAAAVAAFGLIGVLVFPSARAAAAALTLTVAAFIRPRRVAAGVVVASIALVLLIPSLRERFVGALTATSSGDRTGLLQSGLTAVAEHPLAGVGLGRFKPALYAPPDAAQQVLDNAGKSHNQFLSVAAEGGIPHALLFLWLLAALGVRLYRAPPSPARLAGLGALGFFVLLSLAHDPLFHAVLSQALALTLGSALGLAEQQPDEDEGKLRSPLQVEAQRHP